MGGIGKDVRHNANYSGVIVCNDNEGGKVVVGRKPHPQLAVVGPGFLIYDEALAHGDGVAVLANAGESS
jgi:hypothetical protein